MYVCMYVPYMYMHCADDDAGHERRLRCTAWCCRLDYCRLPTALHRRPLAGPPVGPTFALFHRPDPPSKLRLYQIRQFHKQDAQACARLSRGRAVAWLAAEGIAHRFCLLE